MVARGAEIEYVAFKRPPTTEPRQRWRLYGAPPRPAGSGNRRRALILWGIAVPLLLLSGLTGLVLYERSSSTSSSAPPPTAAGPYQTLSDTTIRKCPPPLDESGLTTFDVCLGSYGSRLDALPLPSTLASSVLDAHQLIQQLSTCRSHQLHEDTTMREWPVGCPQRGPMTVAAAQAADVTFRHQYYVMLLSDDNTIRKVLALPGGAAPAASG